METTEKVKSKWLKTKLGPSANAEPPRPNSTFHVFENAKTGKKIVLEQLAPEDIEANRNPAYKYLA
jgi:hypothetical protein